MLLHLWYRLTCALQPSNCIVSPLQRPGFFSIKSVWSRFLMRLEVRFTSSGSTHTRLEHLLPPPFPSALVANRLIPVRGAPLFRRDGWTQVLETERVYYLLNGELTGEGGRRERLTENLEKSSEGKDGGNRKIPTFPLRSRFHSCQWRLACSISARPFWAARICLQDRRGVSGSARKMELLSSSLICSVLQITVMFCSTLEFFNSISGFE